MAHKPYVSAEVMYMAAEGVPLDPLRVLATYADPNNWKQVNADQRCYWAWDGPTITGYELAQNGVRDAR